MAHPLAAFPVVIEVPVAWGEMDSFQHVNNTVYFRWFESSRIAYSQRIGLLDLLAETGVGPILASTSCRFRHQLRYPDKVLVGARVASIGADRLLVEHRVYSTGHERVAAEGEARLVVFNYRENRKDLLPDALRQRICDLEATVGGVPGAEGAR